MEALDSASPPSLTAALCAARAGYGAWLGYLPPSAGWHSAQWPAEAFDVVRQASLATAGIFFGPDWAQAVAAARARALRLVILDVEDGDPSDFAPAVGDGVRSSGLLAGIYGHRRKVGQYAPHFDLHWYASEHWDGVAGGAGQYGYGGSVCGVGVDISTFDPAVFSAPSPPPVLVCQSGYHQDGAGCVPDSLGLPGVCPPGYVASGDRCVWTGAGAGGGGEASAAVLLGAGALLLLAAERRRHRPHAASAPVR